MNPYKVLGVEKNSNFETIKKAYKTQALKHHPDKNSHSEESKLRFQDICVSFDILKDHNKRELYDVYGTVDETEILEIQKQERIKRQKRQQQAQQQQQQQQQQRNNGGYANTGISAATMFSDFFNFTQGFEFGPTVTTTTTTTQTTDSTLGGRKTQTQTFAQHFDPFQQGQQQQQQQQQQSKQYVTKKARWSRDQAKRKAPNIYHNLRVSLKDLYEGKSSKLKMSRSRICETCDGTEGTGYCERCSVCNGTGNRASFQFGSVFPSMFDSIKCMNCQGTGEVFVLLSNCKTCFGQGFVNERKIFNVVIKRGMTYGQKIVFQEQADEVVSLPNGKQEGCIPGDVVITLLSDEPIKLDDGDLDEESDVHEDERAHTTKTENGDDDSDYRRRKKRKTSTGSSSTGKNNAPKCELINKGKDLLVSNLEVPLSTCLCGGNISLPHNLHPRKGILKLYIPAGSITNSEDVAVFENLGMPLDTQGNNFGSLFLKFKIMFPTKLGLKDIEQLSDLLSGDKKNGSTNTNPTTEGLLTAVDSEDEEEPAEQDDVIEEFELYALSKVVSSSAIRPCNKL